MQVRPKSYTYTTSVVWEEASKGDLSAEGKPTLKVATPPEFQGHPGIWTPEDLYVASANVCLMSTFITMAARKKVAFTAYECDGTGTLEMVDGRFMFTTIVLSPKITIAPDASEADAHEAIANAEEHCLITNSMKTKVVVQTEIVRG